jgi:hypothetical protein
VEVFSSAISGRVGRTWVLVSGPVGSLVAGVVSEVTWFVVLAGAAEIVPSVALAVSGVAVIVLL